MFLRKKLDLIGGVMNGGKIIFNSLVQQKTECSYYNQLVWTMVCKVNVFLYYEYRYSPQMVERTKQK